jgi:diguanylate cyclase (GGDEF)-like protein
VLTALDDAEVRLERVFTSLCFAEGHIRMTEAARRLRVVPIESAALQQQLEGTHADVATERQKNMALEGLIREKDEELSRLRTLIADLERDVGIDPLTAVANRRAFDDTLSSEWRRCARVRQPLAIAFIDLDRLKTINDDHGHGAGDAALKLMAQQLLRVVRRAGEVVARFGGDEFVAIMPGLRLEEACALLDVTVRALRTTSLRLGDITIPIRASIGVAALEPYGARLDEFGLVSAADQACLLAKQRGRDRAVAAMIDGDAISFADITTQT